MKRGFTNMTGGSSILNQDNNGMEIADESPAAAATTSATATTTTRSSGDQTIKNLLSRDDVLRSLDKACHHTS